MDNIADQNKRLRGSPLAPNEFQYRAGEQTADLALENGRLKEAIEGLARVAARINAQPDQERVPQILCDETVRLLNGSAAGIFLEDGQKQIISGQPGFCLPPEFGAQVRPVIASMLAECAQSEGAVIIQNAQLWPGTPAQKQKLPAELRTIAVVLIQYQQQRLGAFAVFTFEQERCFDHPEIAILNSLASLAAQAVMNTRLANDMQKHLNEHQTLHEIDLAITSITNLDLAIDVILRKVVSQLAVDAARILLLDPEMKVLRFARGCALPHPLSQQTQFSISSGPAGRAVLECQSISIPKLSAADEAQLGIASGIERYVSYYNAPLIVNGQVTGVLEVFNRSSLVPDSTWRKFFEALATQTAIAINSIALFEGLQKSNAELALAYEATFKGWSRALDLRDKETEGHTQRVIETTERLARAMGMKDAELENARRGALLHDIGKMAIPDSILLKPGPLNAEEWAIMKKHPCYAYELLSPITYLNAALDIPYCHHEKWDGSGYPRGLRGEAIPLSARVFSVVDVWDALISDRPYRAAWTKQQTRQYIQEQAGSYFDPQVVRVFLDLIGEALP